MTCCATLIAGLFGAEILVAALAWIVYKVVVRILAKQHSRTPS